MVFAPPNVTVAITMPVSDDDRIEYIASAPADHRTSYSGSGLPFQSETQAMDRTPNAGVIKGAAGSTQSITINWPNSFRDTRGWVVPPALHLSWRQGGKQVSAVRYLGKGIHARGVTNHPSRCATKAMFYAGTHELEVRGQEAVLRSGGYDGGPRYAATSSPAEFWGDRPRL